MDQQHFLCVALCISTFFKFCIAADTLSANQTLTDGEVLTSPSQRFELGFFSPGSSTARFLGIWYKATPDDVVWVANRQNPIIGLNGVLTLSKNGTLVLSTPQRSNIWSSNSTKAASTTSILQLLDSGNLVVIDKATAGSSWMESYVWQSFDHPGDTWLPGMRMVEHLDSGEERYLTSWRSADDPSIGEFNYKIENKGLSQVMSKKGMQIVYRAIFWDGRFPGFPALPYINWKTEVTTNKGRLTSVLQSFADSVNTRFVMNYSGTTQRYVMNEKNDGWILMITGPRDLCDNYGLCGGNGICKINKTPVCECLRGFRPKSDEEWENYNWISGCTRNVTQDCQKEDGFLKVEGLKFPDSLSFHLNTSMSIGECHDECSKNCNCSAYADPYFKNETSCLMWFGDLIDTREQTLEPGGGPNIYIRVPVSETELETDWKKKRERHAKKKIILIVAASSFGILILGLSFGGFLLKMRRKTEASKKTREKLELPLFDLASIAAATKNFSKENLIGEGGFGPVYKGILLEQQLIAVKRMSRTSGQGPEEFKNEVILISKLQHRNLVRILGCCIEGEEKMLIYEYMQNKSLDYFLFDEEKRRLLSWPKRFDIIMGIARGMVYLHNDSRVKIIHRDLKTSNILLDENLNAKISDFGLARMFEGDQTTARTKRVVGTYGYMAPEYAFDGKFSVKSDIFSLGVVILEIVSGKRNRGLTDVSRYQNLLEQAWILWQENGEMKMIDPCYKSSCVVTQVKRCIQIGLLCIQNEADERPAMLSVVQMLSSEDTLLPQPKKPGFFLQCRSSFLKRNASQSEKSSSAMITMSDVEAR